MVTLILAISVVCSCNEASYSSSSSEPSKLPTVDAVDNIYSIELPGNPAAMIGASVTADGPLAKQINLHFPALTISECLQRAAAAHQSLPEELAGHPPLAFTEFALHWSGCPDPSAAVTTLLTNDGGHDVLFENLRNILGDGTYTHGGFSRIEASPPYTTRWFGVLVNRRVAMNEVPSSTEQGSSLALQFQLDDGFNGAVIAITSPSGEVKTLDLGLDGSWVVAGVPVGDRVGEIWIELIGHDATGPQVLALFPIQVGRPPPSRWVGRAVADESWIESVADAERFAAGLIESDRRRFGLPDLRLDPDLARVARGHSVDMSGNDFFAHVSPSTGTIMDRLRHSGYPTSFAAENIAMAPTLAEAQESLMRSPGHRAAILSTEATHFGVGVATSNEPGHGTIRHITQVFVRREDGQPTGIE